jgi:hypothetical protein
MVKRKRKTPFHTCPQIPFTSNHNGLIPLCQSFMWCKGMPNTSKKVPLPTGTPSSAAAWLSMHSSSHHFFLSSHSSITWSHRFSGSSTFVAIKIFLINCRAHWEVKTMGIYTFSFVSNLTFITTAIIYWASIMLCVGYYSLKHSTPVNSIFTKSYEVALSLVYRWQNWGPHFPSIT